jgi:signal transduction histidine kinase
MRGLAAGVAHEINNPLSGVLQNCQNLRRRLSTDLQANRQVASAVGIDLERLHEYLRRRKIPQFLDMVKDAAERASRIINDFLVFGRRNPEGFEKVSVTDLLETTLRLASSDYEMKRQTDFNRLEIVRDFAGGLPLLHCERSRIEQVLLNLIRNAAQAMALADTSAPRRITLRARRDGERALLEVEDNGPGMSDDIQRRAFEPFFTTKALGAGAGLGLSVVYFIVTQQHGGSIDIASTPSKGSRFSIRLPFTPDPPGKAPGF